MIASGALFPIGTHKFAKGGNQNYNKNVKYHKDFLILHSLFNLLDPKLILALKKFY